MTRAEGVLEREEKEIRSQRASVAGWGGWLEACEVFFDAITNLTLLLQMSLPAGKSGLLVATADFQGVVCEWCLSWLQA